MSINLLAISVGNSRTQLGIFVNGELERFISHNNTDTSDLTNDLKAYYELIKNNENPEVFIASVNEPAAIAIAMSVQKDLSVNPVRIEKDINVPIGRKLDPESIIGEDRLLNAACAYDTLKEAVVIVDAGTAVTIDFVDGEGTFHGGAILPGAQMQLQAMHEHTDQLPEITLSKPDESIGHNTAQAMLTGVFNGIRGAVRELVEKYAEFYMAYPRVIATGGNAEMLFEGYDLVEKIVPEMTLLGMAVTYRLIKASEED